jgi:hypothetical protein
LERLGVPTITLFTQAFAGLADVVARGQQAADLKRIILPHPLNNQPEADIRTALGEQMAAVVAGLTQAEGS